MAGAGELVMDLVKRDIRPSTIVTRASIENAIASVAATGGSHTVPDSAPALRASGDQTLEA